MENALVSLADVNVELGLYDRAFRLLNEAKISIHGARQRPTLFHALMTGQLQSRNLSQPLDALSGIQPFLKTANTIRESRKPLLPSTTP